jgi:carbamoyl-phosphate synthase large subunit
MIPVWVYPLAAALAVAIGWRVSARYRIRRRLAVALRSPREIDRTVGARECVAVGVTETASMLMRLVRRETSRAVLDELVIALAERQWEPASKATMVDLRLWARAYALEHPEVLVVASHAPPGAGEPAEPAVAELPATGEAAAVVPARVPEAGRSAVVEVAPTTVLVTPAGPAAALATIRELRGLGHRVIAADQDALSAGLRAADASEVLSGPGDPGFAVCLVQAIRRHGAAALICTAAAEQAALELAEAELAAAGVRWARPRATALRACADTSRLRAALRDSGLTVPAADAGEGWRTFTADALMSAEGQLAGLVTHWRLETVSGLSARAETFADHQVSTVCARALKALQLTGPASVLGAVTAEHEVVLLQVQPYYTAELPLSLHAGADLVGQYLRQLFGLPVLPERLAPRAGVTMTRDIQPTFQE